MITLQQQIECVEREISLRKRVYSRAVRNRTMTPEDARRELDTMTAVLETLKKIKETGNTIGML